MVERKSTELSRRAFIQILLQILGISVVGDILASPKKTQAEGGVSTDDEAETGRHLVESWRHNLQLFFTSATDQVSELVHQLNQLWSEFFLAHEPISPGAMEGMYTKFGPSSIARGQLLVMSDELRRLLELHNQPPAALRPSQQNILRVRDVFDQHQVDERFDLGSPEYVDAFMEVLLELGYEGIVAMKSPNDAGREVYVRIWNKLKEDWSEPMKAICLNTANYNTWRDWVRQHSVFHDYSGTYNATMGWVIELGDELVAKGGTEYDAQNLVGGFVQVIDTETLVEADIAFPPTERVRPNFHPAMRHLARDVQSVVQDLDHDLLESLLLNLPDTFEHPFGESTKETEVNEHSLIPYILYEQGLRQGLTLPFFYGNDYEQLNEAMEQSQHVGESRNGLPLGRYLVHEFLRKISNAGYLHRHILVDEITVLPDQVGIFFIEKIIGDVVDMGPHGFTYVHEGNLYCAYVDENRFLHRVPLTTLHQQHIAEQPMNRIVVLTAI